MVIVTGAFIAQRAQEQIGGEGTLLIEQAGLHHMQIGADGNTEPAALVVVIRRELKETYQGQQDQLIVDLRYPPPAGLERDWRVLDIYPGQYASEVALIHLDFILDANMEGLYQFEVACNGTTASVPLRLFRGMTVPPSL